MLRTLVLPGLVGAFLVASIMSTRRNPSGVWRVIFKMAASTGFVAVALAGGALGSRYGELVLAALVVCWFGDLFLAYRDERLFLAGLVAFLMGHFGLMGGFVALKTSVPWCLGTLVVLLGVDAAILRWLFPQVPRAMRVPVLAYVTVITAMVVFAVGAWGRGATGLIPLGAALFYVSDIFVARDRFVASGFANEVAGLPLYYGATTLLALSVGAS